MTKIPECPLATDLRKIFVTPLLIFLTGCDYDVWYAKKEVASMMLDPASAEFRDAYSFLWNSQVMVCGEVNGKNSFGAMAGYRYFIYNDPLVRIGNSKSNHAIYRCCRYLKENVSGEEQSTAEIPECGGIEPPLPLSI